jgi:hypothetical protein
LFLVQLPSGQAARWLFLHRDPRADGCPYEVIADVELDEGGGMLDGVDLVEDDLAQSLLGRSLDDGSRFKRFHSHRRLRKDGFEFLSGSVLELTSWSAFMGIHPVRSELTMNSTPSLSSKLRPRTT